MPTLQTDYPKKLKDVEKPTIIQGLINFQECLTGLGNHQFFFGYFFYFIMYGVLFFFSVFYNLLF